MKKILIALLCLTGAGFGHAASKTNPEATNPEREIWRALLFDGIKVGHMLAERNELADRVITRETMRIDTVRAGVPLRLGSVTEYRETKDGQPLGFRQSQLTSDQESVVEGSIVNGVLHIETRVGGLSTRKSMPYPKGALLGEGINQALVRSGMKPGSEVRLISFDPALLEAIEVVTRFGPRKVVELMDKDVSLIEVEQTIRYPGFALNVRASVDDTFDPQRMSIPLLGMQMEIVRCSKACALAKNQSSDTLQQLLIKAPKFDAAALHDDAEYLLRSRDGTQLALPEYGEQQVSRQAGKLWLHVDADSPSPDPLPKAELARYLEANEWLQSNVDELKQRALTLKITDKPLQTMQALTQFVRAHIRDKGLAVGYASALEAYQKQRGDCTEHALLLAALGRAAGIPTRVANGFAFTDYYAGQQRVFVPHAWTQAYVDGRWRSFDAALDGYDAGHIAIAVGNGDPARYYAALAFLGNLEIIAARAPKLKAAAR